MEQQVEVKNPLGLHTRPATMIVKLLQKHQSQVFFSYKEQKIDARSILNILLLAAPCGAMIDVEVSGEDAQETLEALEAAFDSQFGETL